MGICAKNICEELANRGHEVYVISQKTSYKESDNVELFRIHICRISTHLHDVLLYSSSQSLNPFKKIVKKIINLSVRLVRHGLSVFGFTNLSKDFLKSYYNQIVKISNEVKIDVLIPFCFPFETCLAAGKYKAVFPEVRLYPFLMDRYALSTSLHRYNWNKELKLSNHIRLENQIMKQSDKIFYLNSWEKSMTCYHRQFLNKAIKTEHPLLVKIHTDEIVKYKKEVINIVYTGALLRKVRNPDCCFRIFDILMNNRNDVYLHIYGPGDCADLVNSLKNKHKDSIFYYGSVSSEIAHAAIINADYLLSIGNSDIEQVASKNFEYISTGNPIIHFSKSQKDPVNALLGRYSNSLIIYENEISDNIYQIVNNLSDFLRNDSEKISFSKVQSLFSEALPSTVCDLMTL